MLTPLNDGRFFTDVKDNRGIFWQQTPQPPSVCKCVENRATKWPTKRIDNGNVSRAGEGDGRMARIELSSFGDLLRTPEDSREDMASTTNLATDNI